MNAYAKYFDVGSNTWCCVLVVCQLTDSLEVRLVLRGGKIVRSVVVQEGKRTGQRKLKGWRLGSEADLRSRRNNWSGVRGYDVVGLSQRG